MRDRLLQLMATGFGAGRVPGAPGTAGSLVGVGYCWLVFQVHNPWLQIVTVVAGLLVAVWCAGATARAMGQKDPSCVVIDEITAVPVALAGATGWWAALAFVLFRVFDVWKPGPARWSQRLPGGWGIVADDVLAAVAACAVTHLAVWFSR